MKFRERVRPLGRALFAGVPLEFGSESFGNFREPCDPGGIGGSGVEAEALVNGDGFI
jgi:hypothetical protein